MINFGCLLQGFDLLRGVIFDDFLGDLPLKYIDIVNLIIFKIL
jgi:hypothetical protein